MISKIREEEMRNLQVRSNELYDDRYFLAFPESTIIGEKITDMLVEIPDNIELGDN